MEATFFWILVPFFLAVFTHMKNKQTKENPYISYGIAFLAWLAIMFIYYKAIVPDLDPLFASTLFQIMLLWVLLPLSFWIYIKIKEKRSKEKAFFRYLIGFIIWATILLLHYVFVPFISPVVSAFMGELRDALDFSTKVMFWACGIFIAAVAGYYIHRLFFHKEKRNGEKIIREDSLRTVMHEVEEKFKKDREEKEDRKNGSKTN